MSDSPGPRSWSLDEGIKPREWPEEVRKATEGLRQGLLVEGPPFVYAANPAHPIHEVSTAWAASAKAESGVVNVLAEGRRPPYGIIATQTCDLVEEGKPKRPWIQIAPVYEFRGDKGQRKTIERGIGLTYLCHVTGLTASADSIWVADLRLLIPAEKGWLVGREFLAGFDDETGFDLFGERLAARFGRHAIATVINDHLLGPTLQLLREIVVEYEGADGIEEVGMALGRSRLDPTNAQLVFLLEHELPEGLRARIIDWWNPVAETLRSAGLETLMPRFTTLDELSAREYLSLEILNAALLSPAD